MHTDDLRGLIAALNSKNPDATIAVKATYEKTIRTNMDFNVPPNPTLSVIIEREKGVPDLMACQYYFRGNISSRTGSKINLANLDDSANLCHRMASFPTDIIYLENDSQILRILTFYKTGKKDLFSITKNLMT